MADKWSTAILNDVALATDYVANGSFASLKENVKYQYEPDYAVLVRTVDFNNSWNGNFVWVDKQAYEFLSKSNLEPGDLVLSNVGSVGIVFRVPDLGKPMTIGPNAVMCRTRDQGKLDQRFLFYYFISACGQQVLRSITSGSVQPKFNKTDFRGLKIPLPPIGDQRAIAHILGMLDDKIELNRKMNETLEAMARALFNSWFVDFDPVRAKADGRPTGLPKHIADLFPNSFIDSESGEIPKGWEIKPIGDLADVVGGSTPSTKEQSFWEGGTHAWATPKDLSALSTPVLLDTERRITDAGLSQIGSGLLPKGTVLLSSRAPIGYLAIAEIPVAINQGFIAMKPKNRTPKLFLLLWANAMHDAIVSRANGSTFLEISKANFRPIPVVTPSTSIMRVFEKHVQNYYDRVISNERTTHILATLRDTLLPKLISGELRVLDMERIVGRKDLWQN